MENGREIPEKPKNRATLWSKNPTPEHVSRENKFKEIHTPPMFIYNCQDIEAAYTSIDRWMDKEDVNVWQNQYNIVK